MTNPQERPELRASILDAFDKWDREVRRPARRRRIATVSVGVALAVGTLWSGILLYSNRQPEEVAVSKNDQPPTPADIVPPAQIPKSIPSTQPAAPAKPPKKSPKPVFRGAENQRTIQLTPNVQLVQGTEIRPISGVTAPVEVNTFTVSISGEIWRIGLSGGQPLKMVGGTSGFILPTESGPVTVLFSVPVIEKGVLFGTRVGKTESTTPTITLTRPKSE